MLPPIHTLLVEDDRAYARIVLHTLRRTRPECALHHVTDGEEAINYVYGRGCYADRAAYPLPQLILLDLRMPRVDGFEVLRQLKQDPDTRDIPIVVLTSSDLPADRRRCEAYGADLFQTKPANFAEIFQWLEPRCAAACERQAG